MEMACCMSLKVHFLHSHLDFFPENVSEVGNEQDECFLQYISQWNTAIKVSGTTL
jgi:hypothetical protein